MSNNTEQRELDQLADQLKELGELKRDKRAAADTYQQITGHSLGRGFSGLLRPVLAVVVLALIVIPLVSSQTVGGLFGKATPSPTVNPTPTTAPTSAGADVNAEASAETPAGSADASVNGSVNTNNIIPSVPAVQKPKAPVLESVQNTVNNVVGGLGL